MIPERKRVPAGGRPDVLREVPARIEGPAGFESATTGSGVEADSAERKVG